VVPFDEARWPEVLALADAVIPFDPSGNRDWLQHRQQFPTGKRRRRHYGVIDDSGGLVAYGCIEEQAQGSYGAIEPANYRLFVLPASDELWESAGSVLYDQLMADASDLRAQRVFLREHSRDAAQIAFLQARGFREAGKLLALRAPEATDVSRLRPLVHFLEVLDGEHCLVCPSDARSALGVATELGFQERFQYVVMEKRLRIPEAKQEMTANA
jgi:hypothetical protein